MLAGLGLTMPVLVDAMDDAVSEAFAAWPERLYVVRADATLEYVGGPGPFAFDPDEAYARAPSDFLKLRTMPAMWQVRRTLVDLQVTTVFPNGLASRFHQVVLQPLVVPDKECRNRVNVGRLQDRGVHGQFL